MGFVFPTLDASGILFYARGREVGPGDPVCIRLVENTIN